MKRFKILFISLIVIFSFSNCNKKEKTQMREMIDSTGFATKDYQMDSINQRITRYQSHLLNSLKKKNKIQSWRTVISPHDDYSYVGYLYPAALSKIKTKYVVLIGVAHKARQFSLENKIVFGHFDSWKTPYGKAKVAKFRKRLISYLHPNSYIIHHKMMKTEHSLEAIIPFIQKNNPEVEILPVLIPYISYNQLTKNSLDFAEALHKIMKEKKLEWGKDLSIVISSDAVHYGDEDWGGKNFAKYGADSSGYKKAVKHEKKLINSYLTGSISQEKIEGFYYSTVKKDNYKEYKWTWCGRYSIPFGLLTSLYLSEYSSKDSLTGELIDYSTSIDNKPIPVKDIGMGHTAPANIHHWVGYPAIGFR